MNNKWAAWGVVIITPIIIIASIVVVIKDILFFTTKKETNARVVSIIKPSDYKIELVYYNEYQEKDIPTTVNIEASYKKEIEEFGNTIPIYYGKMFPANIYIKNYGVRSPGILAFQFFLMLASYLAFRNGLSVIKRRVS